MPLLMLLFGIPFLCSLIALLLPKMNGRIFKGIAIGMSLIPLFILLYNLNTWSGTFIQLPWLPPLSIEFYLKVDALSFIFLLLTAIVIPISLLAIKSENLFSPNLFYALTLFVQGLLIGFFTARDLALFTLFWESMLIPLFFIITYWGGPKRQEAALKFLVYMIAGSALMVAAVLFLYLSSASTGQGTFNLDALSGIAQGIPHAKWLFAIFLLAFAVKTPLFPFHAWLPDAYTQAPTTGTILLSAILSKAGIYGILRIGMGLFPLFLQEWSPFLLGLAITGVLYGGLAAWSQNDFKRLIAYSSFSHVNFILIGLFVWNSYSHEGAILQAFNHGITIAALFLVAGWLEQRLGSTAISKASGLAKYLPRLCWLTLFFVLASVAVPGTNNFVGELLILLGLFIHSHWLATLTGLSIILSVIYMLRWMQKVYFDEVLPKQKTWVDLSIPELLSAFPLVAIILWVGIYPTPLLRPIKQAVDTIQVPSQFQESK